MIHDFARSPPLPQSHHAAVAAWSARAAAARAADCKRSIVVDDYRRVVVEVEVGHYGFGGVNCLLTSGTRKTISQHSLAEELNVGKQEVYRGEENKRDPRSASKVSNLALARPRKRPNVNMDSTAVLFTSFPVRDYATATVAGSLGSVRGSPQKCWTRRKRLAGTRRE